MNFDAQWVELGTGFTFVAGEKTHERGKDDFHLDLLFFHRHLRRLIVGQIELYLYLRWLDKD